MKVCGLILSCIWQVSGIEDFICSYLEHEENVRLAVAKDIRKLIRFSIFLNELELGKNILEKQITEMTNKGKFCEELECLTNLQEKTTTEFRPHVTTVKVSILQLAILWQMYAVAKLPGHSENTASYFRKIILWHKKNDIRMLKTFLDCSLENPVLGMPRIRFTFVI